MGRPCRLARAGPACSLLTNQPVCDSKVNAFEMPNCMPCRLVFLALLGLFSIAVLGMCVYERKRGWGAQRHTQKETDTEMGQNKK